ncbi:MAG: NAD-dependent epimerase/dehydratase [uncultured bacterium]|nr:MAG: NAD-dependent epimerase/dehydratase [uncultured bacterium]
MELSKKKYVFITGATGFIGSYVVKEFIQNGWIVAALIHKTSSTELDILAQKGISVLFYGDVSHENSLINVMNQMLKEFGTPPEVIVHCAGRASDVGRDTEFKRNNFDSVRFIGQWVLKNNIKRFIFVSTTDVYGLRNFNHEREEELSFEKKSWNPYPKYKIAAEKWLIENLPSEKYVIIRPAAVWGVGDKTLIPRILNFIRMSPFIIHFGYLKGKNRWPLAHVKNVATVIYLAAMLPEMTGISLHVLDEEYTTSDEFYRMLIRVFYPEKKNIPSITFPFWFGRIIGYINTLISDLFNLSHPWMDPTLYALYSVSSNLDFDNNKFLEIIKQSGKPIYTREQGIEELKDIIRKKN